MNASSIGIIGGADGPTAIFVAASPMSYAMLIVAAAVVIGLIFWLFMRKK